MKRLALLLLLAGSAFAQLTPQRLQVTLRRSDNTEVGISATPLYVICSSGCGGAVTNAGTFATQATIADGGSTTLGAKADAKSTATDTTAVTAMQVLKEISFMEQTPASRAVTNAGTFAVQLADGADTTLGAKADAKSTATDTTSITIMQVLKQISASVQAPPSQAVTNAGTFAAQATLQAGSALAGEIVPVTTATTTDTASTSFLSSAASTNSTSVKGSAGNLYGIRAVNTTSTLYYLRLYNSSSAPTCSSATGFIESIPVPHASGNGAGIVSMQPFGQGFATGIGFCLTGGGSSTDNTNAATGVYLTLLYK